MNLIFVLSLFGILMGLGLIVFTIIVRKQLPFWSLIAFPLVGVLVGLSGGLMAVGAWLSF